VSEAVSNLLVDGRKVFTVSQLAKFLGVEYSRVYKAVCESRIEFRWLRRKGRKPKRVVSFEIADSVRVMIANGFPL
jgi:hypothetical protein